MEQKSVSPLNHSEGLQPALGMRQHNQEQARELQGMSLSGGCQEQNGW